MPSSACKKKGGSSRKRHDLRAVGGDGDGVLEVRGPAAVRCAQRPAVIVDTVAVAAAGHEPRLDGEHEPGPQRHAPLWPSLVRYRRVLVHAPSGPVPAEVGVDPVAAVPADLADRM